jgi:hypothetical protein
MLDAEPEHLNQKQPEGDHNFQGKQIPRHVNRRNLIDKKAEEAELFHAGKHAGDKRGPC